MPPEPIPNKIRSFARAIRRFILVVTHGSPCSRGGGKGTRADESPFQSSGVSGNGNPKHVVHSEAHHIPDDLHWGDQPVAASYSSNRATSSATVPLTASPRERHSSFRSSLCHSEYGGISSSVDSGDSWSVSGISPSVEGAPES